MYCSDVLGLTVVSPLSTSARSRVRATGNPTAEQPSRRRSKTI